MTLHTFGFDLAAALPTLLPMNVFNSLLPIFLMIALGKLLTRTSIFSADLGRNLNRLTYWVAMPALLLYKIPLATFSADTVSRLSLLLILATILSAVVGAVVAHLLGLKHRRAGAFVQGSARGNNAFVGLPVILYSMAGLSPNLEAVATIALAPAIVFYNIYSVTVLLAYGERKGHSLAKSAGLFIRQTLTNPLIISCVIGLLMNAFGIRFPVVIERSLGSLSGGALALALLSIGTSLTFKGLSKGLALSSLAACIKVFIQPLIGLGLAMIWDLPAIDRQMLLIYLASPTAVASFVMADIFDSDSELAGHIIVVSTLLSSISLSLVIILGS